MSTTADRRLGELKAEAEEQERWIEKILEPITRDGRAPNESERSQIAKAKEDLASIGVEMDTYRELAAVQAQSRQRHAEIANELRERAQPYGGGTSGEGGGGVDAGKMYRSAGAYVADVYLGRMGDNDAVSRVAMFHRVAAHQTTADNPGLIPERIVSPVVDFVDATRPLVTAIGPTDLGTGTWAYARVTQHTQVAVQAGEKTELASRKMTITKTPITAPTYGGYVNVSRQDISRTAPGILDMVIADLAAQYAIQTESACGTDLAGAATAGPVLPADPTAADISGAIWTAAGAAFQATGGQGRTVVAVAYDTLGLVGPLYPPNTTMPGTGLAAGDIASGRIGSISGLTVVASPGLPDGTILVINSAAVKCFEDRYGSMQVNEPSVWGVQVGYAGDFETLVVEPGAVIEITQTVGLVSTVDDPLPNSTAVDVDQPPGEAVSDTPSSRSPKRSAP
jgi:HK97 family phage major capsid protein